jgi:hypothetical protein
VVAAVVAAAALSVSHPGVRAPGSSAPTGTAATALPSDSYHCDSACAAGLSGRSVTTLRCNVDNEHPAQAAAAVPAAVQTAAVSNQYISDLVVVVLLLPAHLWQGDPTNGAIVLPV